MSDIMYPIIPFQYIAWKGKTFHQIIASIQKNKNNAAILRPNQLRHPLPLNIYRKEIASKYPTNCNPRISTKITDIDMPGGSQVSMSISNIYRNGLANTLDITYPNNTTEIPGLCQEKCIWPAENALRRVRSSGMIKKKFDVNKNNDTYSTSNYQYLVSRNKTIKQNEYNYIRQGDSGVTPGSGLSKSNIYSPAGLSHCYQPLINSTNGNNYFDYVWIYDTTPPPAIPVTIGNTYRVTIPDGLYNIESLNILFQNTMSQNGHYLLNGAQSKVFLLTLSYNTTNKLVLLIGNSISYSNVCADIIISGSTYTSPNPSSNPDWYNDILNNNSVVFASSFVIPDTSLQTVLGFIAGTYTGTQSSNIHPCISPNYVELYYKPNNPEFGVQGAVDSSTLIHRKKYNTINTSASQTAGSFGQSAANALSYGVSENPYTTKTQAGYPLTLTPSINKNNGEISCQKHIYRL